MRRLATLLFLCGLTAFGWTAWTLLGPGGEPITNYMQHREQGRLRSSLPASTCTSSVRRGRTVGVLKIPALGLDQVVVQGTGTDDLSKGPGHYPGTGLPGQGRTIAVAGHRTTWGAPFRHLDALHAGDVISFCGVRYHVRHVVIVDDSDWSLIHKHRSTETLILSTCNPVYSASQRLLVVAT